MDGGIVSLITAEARRRRKSTATQEYGDARKTAHKLASRHKVPRKRQKTFCDARKTAEKLASRKIWLAEDMEVGDMEVGDMEAGGGQHYNSSQRMSLSRPQ